MRLQDFFPISPLCGQGRDDELDLPHGLGHGVPLGLLRRIRRIELDVARVQHGVGGVLRGQQLLPDAGQPALREFLRRHGVVRALEHGEQRAAVE